ncbi:MAG: tetratricopeptide repeat protein [Bacteroidota bacterium]
MENDILLKSTSTSVSSKSVGFINLHFLKVCILIFFPIFLHSQSDELDSLNKVIKGQATMLSKAKAYVSLSENFFSTNMDTVIPLCEKALEIIKVSKLNKEDYHALKQTEAQAYNNIGAVHYINSSYAVSIKFYIKALKIREKIKDNDGVAETSNNIGLIYYKQADTVNAITYYKKSLKIIEKKNNNDILLSNVYNNLGLAYPLNSNQSLIYFFKSLEIAKKLKNYKQIGGREHNIAVCFQNEKKYRSANEWYLKSIETKTRIDDQMGISTTLISLARLKIQTNNISEAEQHAKEAYLISKEYDFTDNSVLSCEILYDIYLKKKNYKAALEMLVELNENKEEQITLANATETVRQQLNYDYDKKRTADSIKSTLEKETLNLKLEGEKQKQLGLYLFLILAIGFSGIVFNRFKKIKKQKTIIENQKLLVEVKNKEITDSINYAKRIQQTLLANEGLLTKNLENHFIVYKPKDIVSGDFYWATQKGENFFLAVCDSTGHGVPGAFMSLLNISFLNEAVNEQNILEPHKILNFVRKCLITNLGQDGAQDGMDGVLLCFNSNSKKITYSAAYNAPLVISGNQIQVLSANRMPIGKSPKEDESFELYELDVKAGNCVYLYTDGFTDQFGGPRGKKFKLKQFQEVLLELSQKSLNEQKEEITSVFEDWKKGYDQIDDMLVIGIKI